MAKSALRGMVFTFSGPEKFCEARSGQVFWLTDRPTLRTFPSRLAGTVAIYRISSPITATDSRPTLTAFPLRPSWDPDALFRQNIEGSSGLVKLNVK